jgi:hypothetical protein
MKPREPRRKVIIPARMRSDGAWGDVCIRDISSRGLLLQAASPPPRGTYVEIFKARHRIIGRVIWTKERRFGIHTQERLNISAIVEEAAAGDAAPGAAPATERRSDPYRLTAATVARRLERSRRLSAAFQFGCIVACGGAAAMLTASTVQDILSRPLKTISEHLNR